MAFLVNQFVKWSEKNVTSKYRIHRCDIFYEKMTVWYSGQRLILEVVRATFMVGPETAGVPVQKCTNTPVQEVL